MGSSAKLLGGNGRGIYGCIFVYYQPDKNIFVYVILDIDNTQRSLCIFHLILM